MRLGPEYEDREAGWRGGGGAGGAWGAGAAHRAEGAGVVGAVHQACAQVAASIDQKSAGWLPAPQASKAMQGSRA